MEVPCLCCFARLPSTGLSRGGVGTMMLIFHAETEYRGRAMKWIPENQL